MIFNYTNKQNNKRLVSLFYALSIIASSSTALALHSSNNLPLLDRQSVATLIQQSHIHESFAVRAEPETVLELNQIRNSEHSRDFYKQSLQRMAHYQKLITKKLDQAALPRELLVVPLVESGYQSLHENKNPVKAAGIWQIIPVTGEKLGLNVSAKNDERLNTEKATDAALVYLKADFEQFKNWKLAILAYEYGENHIAELIQSTHSSDPWTLARSKNAPANMKKFLAMVDASLLIMKDPGLIG